MAGEVFLQNVKPHKGDLPLTVDIEELDGMQPDAMRKELTDFLKETTAKTGRKTIIYTGLKFYSDYLQGFFDEYPLWLAYYDNPQLTVNTGTHWKFWQHSNRAHVSGVFHGVDFDVFNGDSTAFRKMLIN